VVEFRLIYLGRKGGGAEFFNEFWNVIQETNFTQKITFVGSDYLQIQLQQNKKLVNLKVITSIHAILKNPFKIIVFIKEISTIYTKNESAVNIFIMPSPLDWFLVKLAKIKKEKIIFILHEAVPHTGDSWPTKRSIAWRISNADSLVTLSSFVTSQLNQLNTKIPILTLWHPVFKMNQNSRHEKFETDLNFSNNNPILLFVGRVKKYKGLEILINKEKEIRQLCNLVIAGEGKIPKQLSWATSINRWLLNDEFTEIINIAQILIFPYKDASQSGIIPIAIAQNKYIIASRSGALVEQLNNYRNVEFFDFENPDSLITAIHNIINKLHGQPSPTLIEQNPSDFKVFLTNLMDFSVEGR
jgi:glycosyltransferase involved in cell wall biosynthesis